MILSDRSLKALCNPGWMDLRDGSIKNLLGPYDPDLLNPASIDIRIGSKLLVESARTYLSTCGKCGNPQGIAGITPRDAGWLAYDLSRTNGDRPYMLRPGEFVLAETLETIQVPLDCALECKLKSSRAREEFNHSLAFWFDPGWSGVGTLELCNVSQYRTLPLYFGMRICQVIVHKLDRPPEIPYSGRYQHATGVEGPKP